MMDDSPGTPLGRWKALAAWAASQHWCSTTSSYGWEGQLVKHVTELTAERDRLRDALEESDHGDYCRAYERTHGQGLRYDKKLCDCYKRILNELQGV